MDYRAEDLARDVGVDPGTVSRWERDERSPREAALQRIADVLGVTPAWLRYGQLPREAVQPEVGGDSMRRVGSIERMPEPVIEQKPAKRRRG